MQFRGQTCNLQTITAMEKDQRTLIILILGMLATIGPFSIDMYLPVSRPSLQP